MGEHAYLQRKSTHMRDTLSTESPMSERAHSAASPATVAYTTHDHSGSYGSMASFGTYPMSSMAYDSSSLPTPVSVAGSPSMPEGTSSSVAHSFSHNGSTSQQPTPPGTARPNPSDWFNPTNHQNDHHIPSSQSPSPMTMHPDILEMHGLESSQSPENTAIPVTTADQCYFGRYGVSEQQEDLSPPMTSQALFANVPHVVPSALIKNPLLSSSSVPLSSMSSSAMTLASLAPAPPHVPILHTHINPGNMGRSMTPIDDLHHPYGLNNPLTMFDLPPSYNKRASRAKASKRGETKRRQRGVGRTALPSGNRRASHAEDPNNNQAESRSPGHGSREDGIEQESLQLKDDAPAQDVYLLNVKKEMLKYKGKDMWERIGGRWEERYEKKDRAALQMQVQRAVLKHAIWPESEDKILLEAVEEYDKRRYAGILKIMKERGGAKIWEWKDLHIIKRLVELGEEEFNPQGDGRKARRSRQRLQRRQSAVNLWPPAPNAIYDDEGLSIQTQAAITSEEEDQLIHHLFKPEVESPDTDMMQSISEHDPSMSHANAEMDLNHIHSERVAKQACDQMIALQQRNNIQYYGKHPVSGDPNQYNNMS